MKIGALRNMVIIKAPPLTQDEAGGPTGAWTTVATVWADVRYLNGLETVKAGAETSTAKASIRLRRRTDVTAGMRVYFGATVFNILAVLPDEQDRERLDLACETVVL